MCYWIVHCLTLSHFDRRKPSSVVVLRGFQPTTPQQQPQLNENDAKEGEYRAQSALPEFICANHLAGDGRRYWRGG